MPILKGDERILLQDAASFGRLGKGTLMLTSRRLIFERQTGFISKSTETLLDLPLGDIQNVKVEGLIGKQLVVEAQLLNVTSAIRSALNCQPGMVVKLGFSVSNPQGWDVQIRGAAQNV